MHIQNYRRFIIAFATLFLELQTLEFMNENVSNTPLQTENLLNNFDPWEELENEEGKIITKEKFKTFIRKLMKGGHTEGIRDIFLDMVIEKIANSTPEEFHIVDIDKFLNEIIMNKAIEETNKELDQLKLEKDKGIKIQNNNLDL